MARQMIGANQKIFGQLEEFVREAGFDVLPGQRRFISTNEEERAWLKHLKILEVKAISPSLKAVSFEYAANHYVLFVGWSSSTVVENVLGPVELNAGVVTAILSDVQIKINQAASPSEILQNVLDVETDGNPVEFDFQALVKFFEPFVVFDLQKDSVLGIKDLSRISGMFVCKNFDRLALPFSQETIEVYERLFFQGDSNINCENLLFSLVSVSWRHSFLDVYRSLEHLFPIVALNDVHRLIEPKSSLFDFSSFMERYAGWRPFEEPALVTIFSSLSRLTYQEIRQAFGSTDEQSNEALARRLYKLRNSIVHYRPANEKVSMEDAQWDQLVRGLLLLLEQKYHELNTAF